LLRGLAFLALPRVAGLVALAIYLLRTAINRQHFTSSPFAYFNYLADAFLHGQLHLRLTPESTVDLVQYGDRLYLYWSPFPALLLTPLVALFGVAVSDRLYTAVLAAITVALLAHFLARLNDTGIAPLTTERRGLIVATVAFGSVLAILGTQGNVWYTAQIIGWGCVLVAASAALTLPGRAAYGVAGVALACAFATRNGLIFNGLWLACFLLYRDRQTSLRWRASAVAIGLAPVAIAVALLGWYNAARFGSPLEMGLAWHNMSEWFRADYERYGTFNLHYLPINLYYQFVAFPLKTYQQGTGAGLFWLTPIFGGAIWAIWRERRN
jgi:hypothetical protein